MLRWSKEGGKRNENDLAEARDYLVLVFTYGRLTRQILLWRYTGSITTCSK